MVNPIALAMMALGVVLLLLGLFLVVKRRKLVGIVVAVVGLGVGAVPFVTSFYLAR
jgi:hypothetical protein